MHGVDDRRQDAHVHRVHSPLDSTSHPGKMSSRSASLAVSGRAKIHLELREWRVKLEVVDS